MKPFEEGIIDAVDYLLSGDSETFKSHDWSGGGNPYCLRCRKDMDECKKRMCNDLRRL
jgi:hypothetical protein